MNRIDRKFQELKLKQQKALVTFITAGDPTLNDSEDYLDVLTHSGADLIELGIPFSDPSADGPTIQKSSERALKNGVHLAHIFELVEKFRQRSQTPIILMGYFNPILQYGIEKFCKRAAQAGVDGLIMVDLPPEEADELHGPAQKHGIHLIYLLTPTADESRIQKVKSRAGGFVYFVSITGVTGAATPQLKNIHKQVLKIKRQLSLPLCIGFGIQNSEQAKQFASFSDGVVVGSALVSLIEKNNPEQAKQELAAKVRELKSSLA